jgi:hypothetical protein
LAKSEHENICLVNIPLQVDTAEVMKRVNLRDGSSRMERFALEMMDLALGVARPRGIYRVSRASVIDRGTVDIDGRRFSSRALSKCLGEQPVVYPCIATAGRELDGLPPPDDLVRQFCLDTIKLVIIIHASEYLNEYIKEKHSPKGVAILNPGEFADFPITQQKPLFALFGGAEKRIGVSLTPGGAIKPVKSLAGILFPNETGFLSCQLCTMPRCPGRRAAYDTAVVKEYIGTP